MTDAPARPRSPSPPQAPRTGPLRRLLGPFYFTGVFWYRIHRLGVRVLPEWAKGPFIFCFCFLFFIGLRRVRRAVGANLELPLGRCSWLERQRRAWRTIHGFAWCLTERYEQFVPGLESTYELTGEEIWERALESERGLVLLTAHLGNWEAGSALVPRHGGRTVHLARERELDPESQAFIQSLLTEHFGEGYHTHFLSDDLTSGLGLLEALREGDFVALQADRPRAGGKVVPTRLFGVRYELPVGPAVLARMADVEMVPVFTIREGRRRYRVHLRPPIPVERTRDRDADHARAMERVATEIEWAVSRAPEQWYCFVDVRAAAQA